MSLSFSLGRSVFGVADIDVHLAFAGYWAYSILSSLWAGQESWHDIFFLDAILFGPILLLTLLIHGLVHAYTAIYYEASGPKITIWPFLFFITFDENPKDLTRMMDDVIMTAAGPLSHLVMLVFWTVLTYVSKPGTALWYSNYHASELPWGTRLCVGAVGLNFALLMLNLLLPAWPLPGGCILANLTVQCGASPSRAAAWTAKSTQGTAILLVVFAFYTYFHKGDGLLAILLAAWLYYRSQELQVQGSNHALFQKPCFQGNNTQSLLGMDGQPAAGAVDPRAWTTLGGEPQPMTATPQTSSWKSAFSSLLGSQQSHTQLPTDENGLGM